MEARTLMIERHCIRFRSEASVVCLRIDFMGEQSLPGLEERGVETREVCCSSVVSGLEDGRFPQVQLLQKRILVLGSCDVTCYDMEHTLQLSHRPPGELTRPRHPRGWFTQEYIIDVCVDENGGWVVDVFSQEDWCGRISS